MLVVLNIQEFFTTPILLLLKECNEKYPMTTIIYDISFPLTSLCHDTVSLVLRLHPVQYQPLHE